VTRTFVLKKVEQADNGAEYHWPKIIPKQTFDFTPRGRRNIET
jgi:hypothetical protein